RSRRADHCLEAQGYPLPFRPLGRLAQDEECGCACGEARGGRGLGAPRNPIILDAALGPHEALDRVRKHEEMGLTIRGVVLDDLLRRNPGPDIIEPRVPDVVWISVAAKLH